MSDAVSGWDVLPIPGNALVCKTWPRGHKRVTLMVVGSGVMKSYRVVL